MFDRFGHGSISWDEIRILCGELAFSTLLPAMKDEAARAGLYNKGGASGRSGRCLTGPPTKTTTTTTTHTPLPVLPTPTHAAGAHCDWLRRWRRGVGGADAEQVRPAAPLGLGRAVPRGRVAAPHRQLPVQGPREVPSNAGLTGPSIPLPLPCPPPMAPPCGPPVRG